MVVARLAVVAALANSVLSSPVVNTRAPQQEVYDIQGHRGGRGHTVENTLPSFAWGLINGVKSLEMDNGITKDGHVVVWHDESIDPLKCKDTAPVTKGDPVYPYVGKYIANLTLAQVKTLDCGNERLALFQSQILYPGTRISTLPELFSFLTCADPAAKVDLNIESKIDGQFPNLTRTVSDFVELQHAAFVGPGKKYYKRKGAITYQSFDWRTLVGMKKKDKSVLTSALVDDTTLFGPTPNSTSDWLAGINLNSFPGATVGEQIVRAAHSIGAGILSPAAVASASKTADPALPGFKEFTTLKMVQVAHSLGLQVKPWTIDGLNLVKLLVKDYGVDGIITDAPHDVRRWALYEAGLPVSAEYDTKAVLKCLAKHNQVDSKSYLK